MRWPWARERSREEPSDTYLEMRAAKFSSTPELELGSRGIGQVGVCAVEWSQSGAFLTLWANAQGESSIYTSGGGGMIGGGGADVQVAARAMVRAGEAIADEVSAAAEVPALPSAGEVNVILVTAEGMRAARAEARELQRREGSLAAVYEASQVLIRAWSRYQAKLPRRLKKIARLQRSLEQAHDDGLAWNRLGILQYEVGAFKDAIASLDRAVSLTTEPNMLGNRGNVHIAAGDLEAGIRDFSRMIELDPSIAYAWFNRGGAHQDLGNLEQALADLTEAIRLQPKAPEAYFLRSGVLREMGRVDEADADLEAGRKL